MIQTIAPDYLKRLLRKNLIRIPEDYLFESAADSEKSLKRNMPRLYYYLSLRPVKGIFSHLNTDVFLISFPKCGRTWLRLMIGKALADIYGTGQQELLNLKRMARTKPEIPSIEVVHEDHPDYKAPSELAPRKTEFADKRVIFLVRDPRDVVVSLYYQKKHREKNSGEIPDISEFIRREKGSAESIIQYYNIWMANKKIPRDFLLIRYEDMIEDPVRELGRVMDLLKLRDVTEDILRKAAEFASFDNMRSMEKTNAMNSGELKPREPDREQSYKTRKGKVGGFRNELSTDDISFLDELVTQRLDPSLGYRAI